MKKDFFLLVFVLLFFISCGQNRQDSEKEQLQQSEQPQSIKFTSQTQEPFTDPRDGKEYATIKMNDQIWLAQNLAFKMIDSSWFYDDNPENGEKYGRLYTWEAAKNACPPGWHLPTDDEWKQLANGIGGYVDGPNREKIVGNPKTTYDELIRKGPGGFAATFGGERLSGGQYVFLGANGFFWSATEFRPRTAIGYFVWTGDGMFHRFENGRLYGQSCRCIKDYLAK